VTIVPGRLDRCTRVTATKKPQRTTDCAELVQMDDECSGCMVTEEATVRPHITNQSGDLR
jgi:hypothetical protein